MNKVYLVIESGGQYDDTWEVIKKAFKDVVKANHYMNTLIDTENNIRYMRDEYCRCCKGNGDCPHYVKSTYEDDICEYSEYVFHNNLSYRIEEVLLEE